jgi:hypothetical protein
MRISTRLGVVGFLGLVTLAATAGTAFAAGGANPAQPGKGSAETKGGAGPGSSGGGSESGDSGVSPGERNVDLIARAGATPKVWEVGATWETHRVIRQSESAGANKNLNVLAGYVRYDITDKDRIRLNAYLNQRFIADDGETGVRFDDLVLQYRRTIPLPEQFTMFALGQVTAPTSFDSQKSGLITAPRVTLSLEKLFGEYVTTSVRVGGTGYVTKYRSYEGGRPEPKFGLSAGADVEVAMPFHKPLSFGAGVGTSYSWFYQPNSTNDPNSQVQALGTTADTQFTDQPIAQSYFGEVFARYILPNIVGVKSDVTIAAANGDPSLGSVSVLRDGVAKFNLAYRQTAEVYGTLAIRY